MEDRLRNALEFANYKQTLNNQLHKLKIQAEAGLLYAEAGGKFTITQSLICFTKYLIEAGYMEAVILDDNMSPIRITDTTEFLKRITSRYFEVTNDYFRESQLVKKARNVKSVLGLKVHDE